MAGSTRTMMMLWSAFIAFFGLVLMGAGFPPTDFATQVLYRLLGGITPEFDRSLRFSTGLMGAVTFGWGLTVLAVASVSSLLEPVICNALWRRIGMAVAVWYVVDSAISIANGFGLNALSNTLIVALFALILWQSNMSKSNRGTTYPERARPGHKPIGDPPLDKTNHIG